MRYLKNLMSFILTICLFIEILPASSISASESLIISGFVDFDGSGSYKSFTISEDEKADIDSRLPEEIEVETTDGRRLSIPAGWKCVDDDFEGSSYDYYVFTLVLDAKYSLSGELSESNAPYIEVYIEGESISGENKAISEKDADKPWYHTTRTITIKNAFNAKFIISVLYDSKGTYWTYDSGSGGYPAVGTKVTTASGHTKKLNWDTCSITKSGNDQKIKMDCDTQGVTPYLQVDSFGSRTGYYLKNIEKTKSYSDSTTFMT